MGVSCWPDMSWSILGPRLGREWVRWVFVQQCSWIMWGKKGHPVPAHPLTAAVFRISNGTKEHTVVFCVSVQWMQNV